MDNPFKKVLKIFIESNKKASKEMITLVKSLMRKYEVDISTKESEMKWKMMKSDPTLQHQKDRFYDDTNIKSLLKDMGIGYGKSF